MLVALRSRRHIAPFTVQRPVSVAEAVAMRDASGSSIFMAGGIELIDWMKQGHRVEQVIRLDGVPDLSGVCNDRGLLRIGAMTTHQALLESESLRAALPDLAALWQGVANPRVRFAGTIGGNIMAAKPEYDGLPALLAAGATAEVAGVGQVRLDQLSTLKQPLVCAFLIPSARTLRLFADRSLRPALIVWAGLTVTARRATALRIAVGMAHLAPVCASVPLDLPVASLVQQAATIAAAATGLLPPPISDGKGSAAYRRRMTEVLTKRILIRAGGMA